MRAQRTPGAITTLCPGAGVATETYCKRCGADGNASPSAVTVAAGEEWDGAAAAVMKNFCGEVRSRTEHGGRSRMMRPLRAKRKFHHATRPYAAPRRRC